MGWVILWDSYSYLTITHEGIWFKFLFKKWNWKYEKVLAATTLSLVNWRIVELWCWSFRLLKCLSRLYGMHAWQIRATQQQWQTPQIRHLTTAWTKLRPTICVCEVQSSSISIDGEIPFIMHSTAGTLVSLLNFSVYCFLS